MKASDAQALINNVQVVSSTNTIDDAISGVSLSLLKKDPAATTTISVAEDLGTAKTKIGKVVDAFNDLVKFAEDQNTAAGKGDASSVGRDPLLRGVRNALRNAFLGDYTSGGSFSSLAAIGIEFQRTGRMTFNAGRFDAAAASNFTDVRRLFAGDGANKVRSRPWPIRPGVHEGGRPSEEHGRPADAAGLGARQAHRRSDGSPRAARAWRCRRNTSPPIRR